MSEFGSLIGLLIWQKISCFERCYYGK